MAFIRVHELTKSYPSAGEPLRVLNGITLDIEQGEFAVLLGTSGSGKTTFLNMLTGIDKPTSGSVTVGGVEVHRLSERELTRWRAVNIGIIFQFFQLLPTLNAMQNVVTPMDLTGAIPTRERKPLALSLLNAFNVAAQARSKPTRLSGGQQQRVAIARALANRPSLIIADEPTSALDVESTEKIVSHLESLCGTGTTVIIATHNRSIINRASRVLTLQQGRIV
jgi:putative ABC transport system ATP-binding protein